MKAPDINRDEWLGLLESLHKPDDDGATVVELTELVGLDPESNYDKGLVRKWLKRELRSGRVVYGFGHRPAIDGRRMKVPVYRVVREVVADEA